MGFIDVENLMRLIAKNDIILQRLLSRRLLHANHSEYEEILTVIVFQRKYEIP